MSVAARAPRGFARAGRFRLGAASIALVLGAAFVSAEAADPGKGTAIYQKHCVSCHGNNGEPIWPGAPDFRRPGTLLKTDAQLITLFKQGRGVHPAYLGVIKDREMYDLLAHLRTLN
jgi:cytochrome c6